VDVHAHERLLHVFQLIGLDDALDQFHAGNLLVKGRDVSCLLAVRMPEKGANPVP
jgi:hypothetical protein